MDIFAHALWTSIAAKAINTQNPRLLQRRLKIGQAAWWGVLPDLFAFTPIFVWMFWQRLSGQGNIPFIRPGVVLPPQAQGQIELAHSLYNYSHSGIIFLAVFILFWVIRKRPYWELSGWLLHILIDIPTHRSEFFPTPVFWPISDFHFAHGISWAEPWFMSTNYAIVILFAYFFLARTRDKKTDTGK